MFAVLWPGVVRADTIKAAFLSPSPQHGYPFWDDYITFMEVAAKSLGIDLSVAQATNRFEVMDNAKALLNRDDKPDYLVYIYQAQTSIQILAMAEQAGVKSIISNTDVIPQERVEVGRPRSRFGHWIGHIFPDDEQAGYQLAKRLIRKGRSLGLSEDGIIRLLAVGGSLDATSAIYRKHGLDKALQEDTEARLVRFTLANWRRDVSRRKSRLLMELTPQTRMVWAVNDQTALGVLDAMKALNIRPGKNGLTGGIDWSPEGIEAVRQGAMVGTIGGHFMEGAWALILLYDYHHGHDFAATGLTRHSQMRLIDRQNLDSYLPVLDRENWRELDFKRFTKTHNPEMERYDFSPDAVVRALGSP